MSDNRRNSNLGQWLAVGIGAAAALGLSMYALSNKEEEQAEAVMTGPNISKKENNLQEHIDNYHGHSSPNLKCRMCEVKSKTFEDYINHSHKIHNNFICWVPECTSAMKDQLSLAQHVEDKHGWETSGYCDCSCRKRVKYPFSLGQHKRDKHGKQISSQPATSYEDMDVKINHMW